MLFAEISIANVTIYLFHGTPKIQTWETFHYSHKRTLLKQLVWAVGTRKRQSVLEKLNMRAQLESREAPEYLGET
jgi:hypothetical protein